MKKRGFSNVAILILLAIVLLVLVWSLIIPLIKEEGEVAGIKGQLLKGEISIKNINQNGPTMSILLVRGRTEGLQLNISGGTTTYSPSIDFFSVVDTSFSMFGDKLTSAKNSNTDLINSILNVPQPTSHRIGLVSYNTGADTGFHELSRDTNSLTTTVDGWSATGDTCICCGINKAILGFEPLQPSPPLEEDIAQLDTESELNFVQLDAPACSDIGDCASPQICEKVECISNACVYSPVTDGTSCNDRNMCTSSETCSNGACVPGDTVTCPDDGIACTNEACNAYTGTCSIISVHGRCSNGIYCDGVEICNPTLGCQPGVPIDCSDSYECTTSETCNEAINRCDYNFDDVYCENNDLDICNPPGSDPSGCISLPSDELLLDMRFDDDLTDGIATDSSTYANDGTCSGSTCPTYLEDSGVDGKGAYLFGETSNFLTLPAINPGEEITIMGWIKKTTPTINTERVICQFDITYKWCLFISNSKPGATFSTRDGASNFFVYSFTIRVPLNEWTHIAATYDGDDKVRIYFNGNLIKESGVLGSGPISSSDGSATIGRTGPTAGKIFEGMMDNMKIYSRALSGDEIKDIIDSDIAAICGDGAIQAGESCDDGNTAPGDGCSEICQLEEYPRAVILMSDGVADTTCSEQGTGDAKLDAIQAAQEANALGISVYTIGFGTPGSTDFDEDTLREIASAGGGEYFSADITGLTDIYAEAITSITSQYGVATNYNQIKVVFYNEETTEVHIITDPPTVPFETKQYEFNPTIENIIKIEIYPAVLSSTGELIVSDFPKDVWKFNP